MKNPIRKSMLRSPLKTLLKLGIITLTLYFFISSAVKLFVANREIERIGNYYTSIGQLEPLDTSYDNELYNVIPEVRNLIKESEYFDIENIELPIQGVSSSLYNRDFYTIDTYPEEYRELLFYPEDNINLGDMIFIGKLENLNKLKNAFDGSEGLDIATTIEKVISGYPEYGVEGDEKSILAISSSLYNNRPLTYITSEVIEEMKKLDKNSYYLLRGYHNYLGKNKDKETNIKIVLKPLYEGGPLYYPIDNLEDFNLNNKQWDKLRDDIEIIEQNRHTFKVRPVKDMSKLPNMQETTRSYFLTEGRFIDIEDNKSENKVCVIQMDLANQRNLKIGDKISVKHRYMDSNNNYIFTEENVNTWREKKISDEIEYEIVGIITHLDTDIMEHGKDDIYVPESTALIDLNEHNINPYVRLYSFVLKSSKDEAKFIDESAEEIRKLGYELKFVDSNAREFWNNAEAMRTRSLNSTMVFGLLLLIAMLFTLYIHFQDFKRIYAIERTLGIPKSVARKHIVTPILILVSVITISLIIISRYESVKQVEKQILDLATNLRTETTIQVSPIILISIFIGIMIVFLGFLLLFTKRLESKSIIELIQLSQIQKSEKVTVRDSKKEPEDEIDIKGEIDSLKINQLPKLNDSYYESVIGNKVGVLNKFTGRQIIRSKLQTSLLILLSIIFVFSILWLNQLMTMNKLQIENAYKSMEIEADIYKASNVMMSDNFTGEISEKILEELQSTNLIKEIKKFGAVKYHKMDIYRDGEQIINEIDMSDRNENYSVFYSSELIDSNGIVNLENLKLNENVNPEIFTTSWNSISQEGDIHLLENQNGETEIPILASNLAIEKYGLKLGDEISFNIEKKYRNINRVKGRVVGQFEREKLEVRKDGTVSGTNRGEFFIIPIEVMKYIEKNRLYYEKANIIFDKEKNRELYTLSNEIKEIVKNHRDNRTSLQIKIWDEELQKVVGPLEKNLSLLEIVYPITLAISLLTAGFIAYIITLRKAKEMAILRVLGVSNREVKSVSIKESLILTVIGVSTGVILMLILRNSEYPVGVVGYLLAAGVYLIGTILGLWLALMSRDKKKPLELLQVKE
ncbi:ABC transporter permease [Microaceticoccus formicicus]|uniref:ABC transporter permease n=1 Tax=Microaceticoccus formicicus TaxID=3118105 RepID=UPI003CD02BA2|nr:ABC transporter permease [Peptoniphilaceae bacterium AMB_02]